MSSVPVYIFGEVLFDYFPDGEKIIGGAPFNVAWHLQALGAQPRFISRIGEDDAGREIEQAMSGWGMNLADMQHDRIHPTGQVQVTINDGEPGYTIAPDCAYDFISAVELRKPFPPGILYHGSLCLRNLISAEALTAFLQQSGMRVFLDVNLRSPWWTKSQVKNLLRTANWVKMNQDELRLLGHPETDLALQVPAFLEKFDLDQLILTCGEKGARVYARNGELHSVTPGLIETPVDTVGAGDAFSAVYLQGLRSALPIREALNRAQQFASRVIQLRGATTTDRSIYRELLS